MLRDEALQELTGLPVPGGLALLLRRNLLDPHLVVQDVPKSEERTTDFN